MEAGKQSPVEIAAPHGLCRNCGAPLVGAYCSQCGQKDDDFHRPALSLAGEIAQEILAFDSRLAKTFWALYRYPGRVARAWAQGQRRRYATPVRFYIAISLVYFLSLSLAPHGSSAISVSGTGASQISIFGNSGKPADLPAWVKHIENRLNKGAELARTNPAALDRAFGDLMQRVIILMVPVLALILRAFYWRGAAYFVEALVYSFYLHSGVFIILIAANLAAALMPSPANDLVTLCSTIGTCAFAVTTARGYFRQGFVVTAFKWIAIAPFYFIVLALASAGAALFAIGEIGAG